MTERPYSECLNLALALVGVPDSNASEVTRMKAFLNRRARRAYDESPFWPRYYVAGEERIVSEEGLLPYEQENLSTIKTCLRIHKTDPYKTEPALEYPTFIAESDGVQIANYDPAELSGGADMLISGELNPDITGTYRVDGEMTVDDQTFSTWRSLSNSTYRIIPFGTTSDTDGATWLIGEGLFGGFWQSSEYTISPELGNGTYTEGGTATGSLEIAKVDTYSAYVTYTAAFEATYGEGEGETSDVPAEWFDYMAHGGAADFLRAEKEHEAAALMDADAWNYLIPQLESVSRMGGSHAKTRVLSHANMQAR